MILRINQGFLRNQVANPGLSEDFQVVDKPVLMDPRCHGDDISDVLVIPGSIFVKKQYFPVSLRLTQPRASPLLQASHLQQTRLRHAPETEIITHGR